MKTLSKILYILVTLTCFFAGSASAATVIHKDGKTYIKDRTGEEWDVTQAKSLGFHLPWFQYGIGKHAFQTLDDSHLNEDLTSFSSNPRIIGITDGSEAHAYAVPKLKYHEIANTQIGETPVAVGY